MAFIAPVHQTPRRTAQGAPRNNGGSRRCGRAAVALIGFSLLPGCKTVTALPLPTAVACDNVLYANMASLAYHLTTSAAPGRYIPASPPAWHRIRADGTILTPADQRAASDHWLTGLAYDIWQHDLDEHRYVFAYRGSESSFNDWLFGNFSAPISPPYRQARNELETFIRNVDPVARITAVGHSLGGGLALSMSLRVGVRAVVFNTSPRVNDGWGTKPNELQRLLIFETGEPLRRFSSLWANKLEHVTQASDRFEANLTEGHPHRHDMLACGLTRYCSEAPASDCP